jgi:hypothetical protein
VTAALRGDTVGEPTPIGEDRLRGDPRSREELRMERWSTTERVREARMLGALDRACRFEEALERQATARSRRDYVRAGTEVENARAEIRRFRAEAGLDRPPAGVGGD